MFRQCSRLTWPRLAVLLALWLGVVSTSVLAEQYVVLDVDGSIEDYAAIATVLQHPDYSSRLRLVTVSGSTWGYGPSVVRSICRFLSLAGVSSRVAVALGQVSSQSDSYATRTNMGGCADVQGFPATPHDAAARGMPYARSDVTSAYGQTYTLPNLATAAATAPTCSYTIGEAANAFIRLLRQADTDRDTIVYLQLGSATNLAALADQVKQEGSLNLLKRFYAIVEVHMFETGFAGGADNVSMTEVLGSDGTNSLKVRLYPPVFYNPDVTFNIQTWGQLGQIAGSAGTAKTVAWLYGAWAAKKARMDSKDGANSLSFFKERGPASSLVVLCALDDSMRTLCHSCRRAAASVKLFSVTAPTATSAEESVFSVTGNNVTQPFYYLVTDAADSESSTVTDYVYTVAASKASAGGRTLVETFWDRWLTLLRS